MAADSNKIIDDWFRELAHATNINQDEAIYNKAYASKERLKKLLGFTEEQGNEPDVENITTNEETL